MWVEDLNLSFSPFLFAFEIKSFGKKKKILIATHSLESATHSQHCVNQMLLPKMLGSQFGTGLCAIYSISEPALMLETWVKLLALAWPCANHCSHLGGETLGGRFSLKYIRFFYIKTWADIAA